MSMRGLTVFIADLRKCRVREAEDKRINKEMANIRTKFKDAGLSGYHKKKYVCKLLYMYILGWDIDFGHAEAVQLISSNKYSEKQIGYLAITLMLNENSDLIRMVINNLKRDLEDYNEIFNCLALHAIANIGGRQMSEVLASDVHRLLLGNHRNFVKKKAALTLLRLYRKHPDVIPARDWASSFVNLLDDHDLGVVLCTTSLVLALAQTYQADFKNAIPILINRLYKIIVEKEYSNDYVYYKVPIPWLQVKILKFLQYYPPPVDRHLLQKLNNVLHAIISSSQDQSKNVQHTNAQNAVLFEAISLSIHLDSDSTLVAESTVLLGRFISSRETNVRYLSLEAMAHLAAYTKSLDAIKEHQDIVISSLKDKDISVRRRALDLLYSMCDVTNAKVIVAELLRVLSTADYNIREEMVLKIAILTEKFATEYSWYVDTILQLIAAAGDYVSEEVWYRVVQIVTNNEDLQEYAAKTVLASLRNSAYHETAVKVGGYILGEFGHLIVNLPQCTPIEQFTTLHAKFSMCSLPTRALLLTTYIKLVNLFPEIKPQVSSVLNQYRHILDSELQQRACEYFTVVNMPNDDILQTICEEMPPFPERESALVNCLYKKNADTEDKRTWSIMEKDKKEKSKSMDSDLLGINETGSTNSPSAKVHANTETYFERALFTRSGILFEDDQLQLGFKSEYSGNSGKISLYVGNKLGVQLSSLKFVPAKKGGVPGLTISVIQSIPSQIPPKSQLHQIFKVDCIAPITEVPHLRLTYITNGAQSILFKLPAVMLSFLGPAKIQPQDFFPRWKQIGGAPRETQAVFRSGVNIDISKVKKVLLGLNIDILDGLDPNPNNIVAAGVAYCGNEGKFGCLFRVEPNLDQQMFRATIRSTNELVGAQVHAMLAKILGGKAIQ
ncbi:Adaptor protein complex AP-2 alpha subunit [Neoconidiobolus thromboides FSU 785]|nr:Adaptor protein complex AP-2 alpha subunit [Neoconidiobolus thromboides FSU 785]